MIHLKWEDIDLTHAELKVIDGKGGKTASTNLSNTVVRELKRVPLNQGSGYLLPSRSRVAIYKRLEVACRIGQAIRQ